MKHTVLVVDDDANVLDVIASMLEDLGCEVVCAASAPEALAMLASNEKISILITDINMPGMDGLQLLGEIKQRHPGLPVMMVTAYGDDERRLRASEYGATEFITKPVDFGLLKRQLQQLPSAAA